MHCKLIITITIITKFFSSLNLGQLPNVIPDRILRMIVNDAWEDSRMTGT